MDRLLEYINRHPFLVSLAVADAAGGDRLRTAHAAHGIRGAAPAGCHPPDEPGRGVYDLREAEAFAAGHIGNAKHLAGDQHEKAADVLKKYREKFLVLYCEDGSASAALARKLHAAGFTKTFNLRGGLATWRAESLPLVR